jgi:23S rRNA (cytidine1920-2'-O)/16S rRNA (cytidine1409-2'-O)-methyltransferase
LATRRRARTVTITRAIATQHPEIDDVETAIREGRVSVAGKPVLSTAARVPVSAPVVVEPTRSLRGIVKLEHALRSFAIDVAGRIALDAGAAAGGFTTALLDAGAARVYAVDAGHGQLRGTLRQDARVVNLERTNIADVDSTLVPDAIDVVTLDLSYLAIASAVPALDRLRFSVGAELVALVKPMFELGRDQLPTDRAALAEAVDVARRGTEDAGWRLVGDLESPVRGTRGAIEFFIHARR